MNAKVHTPAYAEIWNGVVRHKFRILLAVFAAAAITLILSLLLPKTYEGVLLIRIGQITIVDRDPLPIEQPKVVLDRLKNPAFLQRVSERAFKARDRKVEFHTRGLPAGTMEIRSRQGSMSDTMAVLQAAFIELRAAHEQIATPYMDAIREALAEAKAGIDAAKVQQKKSLERMAATTPLTDQRAILTVMVNEIVRTDISDLRDNEMALKRSLLPPFTFMTDMVEPIYVDNEPIFPHPLLNVVLAVLVVLAISVFIIALQALQVRDDK